MFRLLCRPIFKSFSGFKLPPPEFDIANMTGLTHVGQPLCTFSDKISTFAISNLYESADIFSRQLIFTFANDYSLGLGMSIVVISFGVKLLFLYPTIRTQINSLKMRGMKSHMNKFKQKVKIGQLSRNMAMVKQAQFEFKMLQKKKGIDNFSAFLNIFQLPILITWFLSLRYIANLPQIYPQIQTQGFLWFSDLSAYDPYFILPLIAACFSSLSIAKSPSMGTLFANNVSLAPLIKYMKFLPFVSLPITALFPAVLNLYWCVLAISQALTVLLINSKYIQKRFNMIQPQNQKEIKKALIIQQKFSDKDDKSQKKYQENLKKLYAMKGNNENVILLTANQKKKTQNQKQ